MSVNLSAVTIQQDFLIRLLLYGPSGAGKTTFAGTFPEPIFLFDFDHKYKSLYGKNVEVESFASDDKEKAASELTRFLKVFRQIKHEEKYKTLVFDSLSMMDPLIGRWGIQQLGKAMDVPDLQAYGRVKDFYDFFLMEINSPRIGKNIVLTAHELYMVEEESKVHRIVPLITGKMSGKLPAFFEETYYMEQGKNAKGEQVHNLYYRSKGKAIASTQMLRGDGVVENPTYEKIVQLARKGVK